MLKENPDTIKGVLENKKLKKDLAKYIYLRKMIQMEKNAPKCAEFRRIYNDFFDLKRTRSDDVFQNVYYALMQKYKVVTNLEFKTVLKELHTNLHAKTGKDRVEPSFCSKLLSILQPNMPVWDSNVRTILGLPEYNYNDPVSVKMENALRSYEKEIRGWYKSEQAKETRKEWIPLFNIWFDEWYKWYEKFLQKEHNKFLRTGKEEKWITWLRNQPFSEKQGEIRKSITTEKVIDLILWQMGGQWKRQMKNQKR